MLLKKKSEISDVPKISPGEGAGSKYFNLPVPLDIIPVSKMPLSSLLTNLTPTLTTNNILLPAPLEDNFWNSPYLSMCMFTFVDGASWYLD